jgi:hypothetical protein
MWKVIDSIPLIFKRVVILGILVAIILAISLGVLAKCNKVEEPPSVS